MSPRQQLRELAQRQYEYEVSPNYSINKYDSIHPHPSSVLGVFKSRYTNEYVVLYDGEFSYEITFFRSNMKPGELKIEINKVGVTFYPYSLEDAQNLFSLIAPPEIPEL